jgi:spore germination protein GerM
MSTKVALALLYLLRRELGGQPKSHLGPGEALKQHRFLLSTNLTQCTDGSNSNYTSKDKIAEQKQDERLINITRAHLSLNKKEWTFSAT